MKKQIVTLTILVLISLAAVCAPLEVLAQTNIGVQIYQTTPSTSSGPVGTRVNILGSIHTPNSTYQVILGKTVVTTGTSEGYYVNANFTVPELLNGPYALILRDVSININYSQRFTVETGYGINAIPSSVQEGNTLKVNVSVTGGIPGSSYTATVTVEPPSPASKYTKTVTLGAVNAQGTAIAQVNFPDATFQPDGSTTDYVGTYKLYFNQTDSLAESQFSVNILDSTSYHQGQTVNIKATGYQANQAATITISNSKTSTTLATLPVTAGTDGVITASWVVSSDATIGDYIVKISPDGTSKLIQDTQTFNVPGYSVKIKTTNIAGDPVPDLSVQARDPANNVYDATSDSSGNANFKLEKGTHVLTAYLNGVKVGETNITVTGEGTFTLRCELTNLKITVKNTNGTPMPFVNLDISYKYGSSKTGTASGKTDPFGSFTLASALTEATYTIEASMYGQIFNLHNNTFTNLPSQATSEIVIVCPSQNITINVVGYSQEPIPYARIELVEISNGLFYSAITDSHGSAITEVTFGMYRARVYKDNILISETNLPAFNESQKQIRSTIYGIDLSVSVVDFFGSPIANANVIINRPETEKLTSKTQSNGIATFNNIIGGDMQIIASPGDTQSDYQAVKLTVDQPTTVQIKLAKYIALGPLLLPATALGTISIIILAIVVFLFVEIYRCKRKKPASATG
ncbi:MAG: carboxypeptidase-like regulatory domain-containing protein [Candidatus Bathyarchaeota archaeon]|nr:carboxypeptidase-like regulatory domain-containing protein [Candidatus Bathyarchaeota archaeon]